MWEPSIKDHQFRNLNDKSLFYFHTKMKMTILFCPKFRKNTNKLRTNISKEKSSSNEMLKIKRNLEERNLYNRIC